MPNLSQIFLKKTPLKKPGVRLESPGVEISKPLNFCVADFCSTLDPGPPLWLSVCKYAVMYAVYIDRSHWYTAQQYLSQNYACYPRDYRHTPAGSWVCVEFSDLAFAQRFSQYFAAYLRPDVSDLL
jgi:hypothetical protein